MNKWLFTLLSLFSCQLVLAQEGNEWASTTGNAFNMTYYDMMKDHDGNIYSVGAFKASMDFDPGPSSYSLSLGGSAQDGFVQKLDANGNFLWAAGFSAPGWTGSIQHASCKAITCDNDNNIYITGNFIISADFDPGPGTYDVSSNGDDIFILKLNSAGEFAWVRTMGSNYGSNNPYDITFDPSGYIYTSGYFKNGVDFNTDSGVEIITPENPSTFIHKLDLDGNFIWVKTFDIDGYDGYNQNLALALDAESNVYSLGVFSGTQDFNPSSDSLLLSSIGPYDNNYILKLDSLGEFIWAKSFGGTGLNATSDLVIDSSNDLYISGTFSDSIDVDPGESSCTIFSDTLTQAYVLKLNDAGLFESVLTFNSSLDVEIQSLSTDSDKNLYLAGRHRGILDYDPSSTILNSAYSNVSRINFFAKMDSTQNFVWAKSVEGNSLSGGKFIIPDEETNAVYASGYYYDTLNFSAVIDTGIFVSEGSSDMFLMKFNECTPVHGYHTVTACDSFMWIDSVVYTSNNQSVAHILPHAANGCDSIVHLDLSIVNSSSSIDVRAACDSLVWIDGQTYTSSNNTATHTLINSQGCDSIITLQLSINNSTSTLTETACYSYTTPSGQELVSSGIYQDIISNAMGCDSIITIDLTIDTVNTSMTQTGNTLEAVELGAYYQWLDCDDNYTAISGETNQTFTPNSNGIYALEIQQNGCVDTSACIKVQLVSVHELADMSLHVFPNPVKNRVQIIFSNIQQEVSVDIENALGQKVQQLTFMEGKHFQLNLLQPAGVYFLNITNDLGQKQFIKLIKK